MPTHIASAALIGLDGVMIEIETDISSGLPAVIMVGLPDTSVQEARERVRSAIKNSGYVFPLARIAINLAPADLPKAGSLYDLPIALSILSKSGLLRVDLSALSSYLFVGELALDGRLRPVTGILPIILTAKQNGLKGVILPQDNSLEATLVQDIDIFPAENLTQVVAHLEGKVTIQSLIPPTQLSQAKSSEDYVDLRDIAGQYYAKRALIIAAAGHHNILFSGPPGSGKTLLAKALRGLMPELTESEKLEVTKIYSVAGLLSANSFIAERPFRSPHHTSSKISLVGGGSTPKPGEITLAHRGVLFLDEFTEFPRATLDALRQPLEDGVITISRISSTLRFPAEFILIAAQNPCPCGHLGNTQQRCHCSDTEIKKYQGRVSGPILDRIDLVAEVPQQSYEQLQQRGESSSSEMLMVVRQAREIQYNRFKAIKTNAAMSAAEIRKYCTLEPVAEQLLQKAIDSLHLSARAYTRVLKVARTIADIESAETIGERHLSEALQYRR